MIILKVCPDKCTRTLARPKKNRQPSALQPERARGRKASILRQSAQAPGAGSPARLPYSAGARRDPRPGLPFLKREPIVNDRTPKGAPPVGREDTGPAGSIPIGSSGEYGRRGHLLRQVQGGPEGAAALADQVGTWRTAGHARKLKLTCCTWRLVGKNTGGVGRPPRGTGEGDNFPRPSPDHRRCVSTPRPQLLSGSYNLKPVSGKTWPRDTSERVRVGRT